MLIIVASITLRELARNTTAVIQAVEASGRPALVTRNGRPVAALVPVNEAALEDWLLEHTASFTRAVAEADQDLRSGRLSSLEWQQARDAGSTEPPTNSGSPPENLRGSHRGD